MGKLIVVRHGETKYNVEGKYTGRIDIGLNEKGKEQAKELAQSLKKISIDFIISSTLKRAEETAQIISEELNLPITKMQELVERSAGVYEGLTRAEAKNKFPEMWEKNAPKGAETMEEVDRRVYKAIKQVLKDYGENKNVLIVTHGYISKVINKYFNNSLSEEEFYKYVLENCEFEEYII